MVLYIPLQGVHINLEHGVLLHVHRVYWNCGEAAKQALINASVPEKPIYRKLESTTDGIKIYLLHNNKKTKKTLKNYWINLDHLY